jgi:phosphinothricin acetyltransferase
MPESLTRMNAMDIAIGEMRREDWSKVKAIYAQGLDTGLAAFMIKPPVWKVWDARHLLLGRAVARDGQGHILGWAALAPVPDN